MAKWINDLKSEQLGRWNHRLLDILTLDDDGLLHSVPKEYITDFASIRSLQNIFLFPLYAIVAGYGNLASSLHDYLYDFGTMSRKECDEILYKALLAEGVEKWRARLFWIGVRLGGRKHFRKPDEYNLHLAPLAVAIIEANIEMIEESI